MTATDHRAISFWLENGDDDLTPRPTLDGSIDADVAILGAGFTGLWTALYLLRRDPGLRVVVLEREIAGFGASGRNGAWCDHWNSGLIRRWRCRSGLRSRRLRRCNLVRDFFSRSLRLLRRLPHTSMHHGARASNLLAWC